MNNCTFIGRLTSDPEVKKGPNKNFVVFSIAINNGKDKDGKALPATFIECIGFGKTGEAISKFFKKGDFIGLETSYSMNVSEKDNKKFYHPQFIVNGFTFCGGKKSEEEKPEANSNTGW